MMTTAEYVAAAGGEPDTRAGTDTGASASASARNGAGVRTETATAAEPVTVTEAGAAAEPGTPAGTGTAAEADTAAAANREAAERIWRNLRGLVPEHNERRKELVDALGMSFFRAMALRRIAEAPARMSRLAADLASDRPYLTLVVDDLEERGLVERHRHPTDRRCKIVSATPEGLATAARAEALLGTPPPALLALSPADLAVLDRIMASLAAQD